MLLFSSIVLVKLMIYMNNDLKMTEIKLIWHYEFNNVRFDEENRINMNIMSHVEETRILWKTFDHSEYWISVG